MHDNNSERWLPVVGYEGSYEVSSLGRVRSLDRTVTGGDGRIMRLRGRMLKLRLGSHKYPDVSLGRDNTVLVHRLVLEAFRGPCPEGLEACHGNAVRADARLSNLRWDTKDANEHDKIDAGNHHYAKRTHCKSGHEFTPENTHIQLLRNGRTFRNCRACARKLNHTYHRRLKEMS